MAVVCATSAIDVLVTDAEAPEAEVALLRESGAQVVRV
jgi:DeoR/GlpR family transcriptional regulator of sugar metabolism